MIHLDEFQHLALGNLGCLELTRDMCDLVNKNNIKGSFIECGVAYGAQIINMELANPLKRKIHVCDSFQGIPKYGNHDEEFTSHNGPSIDSQRESSGIASVSKDIFLENVTRYIPLDNIVFHEGWFVDTLHHIDDTFALIRLDCDIYESYKVCLKVLYPRLSIGGALIIDDYHLTGCKKALKEYFGPRFNSKFKYDEKTGNATMIKKK